MTFKLIDPASKDPLPIDYALDARVEEEGGFTSQLSWQDRQRLRKVTKAVHMKHYPQELLTDREADRMIEAMGPSTQKYLIERMWDQIK